MKQNAFPKDMIKWINNLVENIWIKELGVSATGFFKIPPPVQKYIELLVEDIGSYFHFISLSLLQLHWTNANKMLLTSTVPEPPALRQFYVHFGQIVEIFNQHLSKHLKGHSGLRVRQIFASGIPSRSFGKFKKNKINIFFNVKQNF